MWLVYARCVDNNDVGNMDPPLGTFWNSAVRSAHCLRWQANHRETPWEEGCTICLGSDATLPKNFTITKSITFLQGCKTSINKIVNVIILWAHQFDNADARRMLACVLAMRGSRGGVPGGRGEIVKVGRLILKLGSRPWSLKHDVRTCTHNYS